MAAIPPPTPKLAQLYLEPVGGVAGDMILGALLDLGADAAAVAQAFANIGDPGLRLETSRVQDKGQAALSVRSIAPDAGHHHTHLADVIAALDRAAMPEAARRRAGRIFDILVAAEAAVHGGEPGDVHLHEVGALDSIMDVVGICVALHSLGDPRVTCAPLPSGHGTVDTSHGVLEVPVPAVVEVARNHGVPLVEAPLRGETITPTGIAVVAEASEGFHGLRARVADVQGAGAGNRRFEDRPNVVRVHGYVGAS